MGEEFPLDPNQMQPPQEGQPDQQPQEGEATHIEVSSQEGGSQSGEAAQSSATPSSEQPTGGESTQLGTFDHDYSSAGTDATEVPSTYVHNKEKAEVMAHAENGGHERNEELGYKGVYPEGRGEQAGKDYDLGVALNKERSSNVKTPEEAREFAAGIRNIYLKYSNAIAESYKEHGDELTPCLKALQLVNELVGHVGYENFSTHRGDFADEQIYIEFDKSGDGAVIVRPGNRGINLGEPPVYASQEQWRLTMFGKGEYKLSQQSSDPDGEYSKIETTKTRSITEEDVAKIEKLLAPAARFKKAEEKRQRENLGRGDEEDDERDTTEDPLAGDVDKQVHPDETRTDDQIAHDEKYRVEPY